MWGILVALISGALMSIQGVFNTEVTKQTSLWVSTVIQSMGSLGPARAAMLIVISQLAVAYVIELFGLFGVEKVDFEWRRLLGMAIAIVGIVIFKWEK